MNWVVFYIFDVGGLCGFFVVDVLLNSFGSFGVLSMDLLLSFVFFVCIDNVCIMNL